MQLMQLVKISSLARYGMLAVVGSVIAMIYAGLSGTPGESALETTIGNATKGRSITTTRRRSGAISSIEYELTVKDKSGKEHVFSMPNTLINEAKVRQALEARGVTVRHKGADVYVLQADNVQLIEYKKAAAENNAGNNSIGSKAVGVLFIGLLMTGLGWLLGRRKLKAMAAPAPAAEPNPRAS